LELNSIPLSYSLSQNHPNPFNPVTTIAYTLPKTSKVNIMLYNMLGERVMTLVDEEKSAGRYEMRINASHLASGIYFYQIQAGDFAESKKMLLLK
jgi:hypothetical protein